MDKYERMPLTSFTQPVENVTLLSQCPRWLMNTSQNLTTVYGPNAWDILADLKGEQETNTALRAEVNQIQDLGYMRKNVDTVFILAPGASLSMYQDMLPALESRGYVLVSPTVMPWLGHQTGAWPDGVVVVDGNPASVEYARMSGIAENSGAVLMMTPEAPPQMPVVFGRERTYWFRTSIPGPHGEPDWEPYAVFQGLLCQVIKTRIVQLGCVTNMMVALALALRDYAGWQFKRIVLVGADYGYWNGLARVPFDGSNKLQPFDPENRSNFLMPSLMNPGLEMWTDRRMARYKASLMLVWMQSKEPIYSMSHGILDELPQVTADNVLADAYPEYPNEKEVHDRIVRWMRWFQKESGLIRVDEDGGITA